jgi:mercuric ion transport protein
MPESANRLLGAPRRGGFAWAALAALTCPCHVPLLVLLLSGTAAGAFLSEHMGGAFALMAIVFLPSLGFAIKRLKEAGAARSAAVAQCCEREASGRNAQAGGERTAANVS